MICAKLNEAPSYRVIHPRLDRVLDMLDPDTLSRIGTSKIKLEDDALFVTRFDVSTVTDETRLFEYHQRYLDVFTLVKGCERVDLACPALLELREHSGDYWGCEGEAEQSVILRPGDFLVLFPGDAHRPGMAAGKPQAISRVVFKILI